MIERLDAWTIALIFAVAMIAFWTIGWLHGQRSPSEMGEDPGSAQLVAYQDRLPWIIVVLLLLGSVVPAFLMGLKQGASRMAHLSGTFSFVVLVTLVIDVTLDLNQPAGGFIRLNRAALERLTQSTAK